MVTWLSARGANMVLSSGCNIRSRYYPRVSVPVDDAIQPVSGPRSRAWIGRAIFEATLIVFGLVGAFLVDEWRDSRERRVQVSTALRSIRTELQANRGALQLFVARNDEVIKALRQSASSGVRYEHGILASFPASSIAWSATRDAGTASDIDHDTLMALGRAYESVAGIARERQVFLDYAYTSFGGPASLRDNPLGLAGWLNDMVQHAQGAQRDVEAALKVLARSP
jgi:hypothetical protein